MRRKEEEANVGAGGEMSSILSFSSLVPVGSLAVLDIQVEKIEDQKLYMSCIAQSRDKQTVYAKSSGKEILNLSRGLPQPNPQQMGGKMSQSSRPKLGSSTFGSRIGCLLETWTKRKRTKLECFPK